MSTAVKTMAFLWTCWKLNAAGAMEFRLSFLLTAGMMFVNNVVWILFWSLFFHRFPAVNGWQLHDVMMLWAVSAGGYGIMAVLFGNFNAIARIIATGRLDLYLAQPKPVLLNVLASRMSVTAIGDVGFGIGLYAVYGDLSMIGLVKFALGLAISGAIVLFFMIIGGSLAFYLGNAEGLSGQFFLAIVTFSVYPTDIFRGLGRILIFTVIPAGFISYLPIGLLRHGADPLFLAEALAATAVLGIYAIGLFRRGLHRYSSGNMMAMRGA